MLFIAVPDMNDSISTISIDGKTYGLRFTYNEKFDYWSFSLLDEDRNPIIAHTKIVPKFPIYHFYTAQNIPNGIFGCLSDLETVGRYAFVNKTAEFVYIPNKELED